MTLEQPATPVARMLDAVVRGDRYASEELLPHVYDELRRLARVHLANEKAGLTLQPTALVHEAYLRLIGSGTGAEPSWDSRGHFFAAAAMAMRRILVERARKKGRIRHGGDRERVPLTETVSSFEPEDVDLVALDDALNALEAHNQRVGRVVMLRYFAGLGIEDVAAALGVGVTTVKAEWNYARAWLHRRLADGAEA
ncbi:MAG: ECF-type sigma factor [Phycisphaerales bacterium]